MNDLTHRAARVRGLSYSDTVSLCNAVEAGTIVLDPAVIDAEVEAYIATVLCHADCVAWVRQYGYASYKAPGYTLDAGLCEVCAMPLACSDPGQSHDWREMTSGEASRRKISHAGACYHVYICRHCDATHSVDSSD